MSETAALYTTSPESIAASLSALLGARAKTLNEVTLEVAAADYLAVMQSLRDAPEARFEQLVDLCGMDYSTYGDGPR